MRACDPGSSEARFTSTPMRRTPLTCCARAASDLLLRQRTQVSVGASLVPGVSGRDRKTGSPLGLFRRRSAPRRG
jgi:hypothetical protein